MSKFVKVEWDNDFESIRKYIEKNRGNNYYIAPKLMYLFLSSLKIHCVLGISADDIKIREHHRIDFIAMPVYNRVFENNAFRVDFIKRYDTLSKVPNEFEYNNVIFGIEEDREDFFTCSEHEVLS